MNLSPSVLTSPEIAAALPRRLDDVVIEITEHELAGADAPLAAALAELRTRGARIAVDDAGYAGLKQITRLQPDLIKLDRALVEGIDADPAKRALVESFAIFASWTGVAVCGEGIETLAELQTLCDAGVHYGQGYALARPGPPWAAISEDAALACARPLPAARPLQHLARAA